MALVTVPALVEEGFELVQGGRTAGSLVNTARGAVSYLNGHTPATLIKTGVNVASKIGTALTTLRDLGVSAKYIREHIPYPKTAPVRELVPVERSPVREVVQVREVAQPVARVVNMPNGKASGKVFKIKGGGGGNRMVQAVAVPVANGNRVKLGAPKMSGNPYGRSGTVRIRHSEFIADISTALGTYNVASIRINPGNYAMSQWLANLSLGFESYTVKGLSFRYESQVSSNTNGTLLMGVDYDPIDTAPVNKTQFMSLAGAVRCPLWSSTKMTCPTSDANKFREKFIRLSYTGTSVNGYQQDLRVTDVGVLYVATAGAAAQVTSGELYIDYDIELHTPQINVFPGSNYSLKITGGGSISRSAIFGTAPTSFGVGPASVNATGTTLKFGLPGTWYVSFYLTGTGISIASFPITLSSSIDTATGLNNALDGTSTHLLQEFMFNITDGANTALIDLTTVATTITASIVRIIPYNISVA